MFESFVSWLFDKFGKLFDLVLEKICGANGNDGLLALSVTNLTQQFPMFYTLYKVLQAIAVGLVLLIAGVQIVRFFVAGAQQKNDTPTRAAIGAFFGAGLIYFGNYAVDALIKLANLPYTAIWNLSLASDDAIYSASSLSTAMKADFNMTDAAVAGGGGIVATLICLICLCIIAFNILKLVIEIFQRLFMVGVLTFTSPLVYATIASSATMQVFRKWLNMLVSQLLLMSLSAWSLKLILGSFKNCADFGGFLFLMAACKVAQSLDTYVQSLGLNTVSTGSGGIVPELIASAGIAAKALGISTPGGNGGGGNNTVLGRNFASSGTPGQTAPPKASSPFFYGAAGGITNAFRQAKFAQDNGGTAEEVQQAAKEGIKDKAAYAPLSSRRKSTPESTDKALVYNGKGKIAGTAHAVGAINDIKDRGPEAIKEAKEAETSIRNAKHEATLSPDQFQTAFGNAVVNPVYTDVDGTEHHVEYSGIEHTIDPETGGHIYSFFAKDTNTDLPTDDPNRTVTNEYKLYDGVAIAGEDAKTSDYNYMAHYSGKEDMFVSLNGNQYILRKEPQKAPPKKKK